MPHFLCFTDLSSTSSSNDSNGSDDDDNPSAATATVAPTQDAPSESAAAREYQRPTGLFAREGNKKSSFVLREPVALICAPGHGVRNGDGAQELAPVAAGGVRPDDGGRLFNEAPATASGGKKGIVVAEASITSCVSQRPPQFAPRAREIFLFGGFELVVNVKTIEVYVSKASNPGEESYLTTCKGIPMRDIPPLPSAPFYVDGTRTEGGGTSNGIPHDDKEPTEKQEALGERAEQDAFYKFIFVSPGGPKPVERNLLKFLRSNASCVCSDPIVVRILKVKGRLSDSIPASNASHQPKPQLSLPTGTATSDRAHMGGLASMMAMMGGGSMTGTHMAMQVNPQREQANQLQSQLSQQQAQQQQQQNNHQQEKHQAEIMAAVAGLGIFMKSSEARTMGKLEILLTNMEMRIMGRLDGLAERLDTLERSINEPTNEHGTHERPSLS